MAGNPRTNLPLALTGLIGREQELVQLERLVLTSRLVTLTGSGGVGKTRLALEVARCVAPEFADGAWLVELAPLTDPALVPAAVAGALGLVDRSGSLLDALAAFLESHELLLVLDNCEHLIAACAALVEELLRRCCLDLRIVATSREPLGVPGEVVWRVPSLSLPAVTSAAGDVSAIAQSEAVRLFVERAQTAAPGFALHPDNAPVIAEICRRLDGIPLAIELAAARVGVLTVGQIAGRLDDRFNLLRTNLRTAPARQQTLAAAIDWSHALLSADEKLIFRRLSVFAGGANLAAVEAICGDDSLSGGAVLDLVSRLVDKSLVLTVVRDSGEETRYHLLETIRQYAAERLLAAGEAGALRDRHLAYYIQWAERAEPELYRANAAVWLGQFDTEHDNFREALSWAINQAEHLPDSATGTRAAHDALRLVDVLVAFWRMSSYLGEARVWLHKALELRLTQEPSAARARALAEEARFAWLVDDMRAAWASSAESIDIARRLGPADRQTLARALRVRGLMLAAYGQVGTAQPLLEESLALYRQIDSQLDVAHVLRELGTTAMNGDLGPARILLDESLAIFLAHGDAWGAARTLQCAARVSIVERDYASARRIYEEALAADEKLSFWPGLSATLSELGLLARLEGDLDSAQDYQERAIGLLRKIGQGTANQTVELGYLALARDRLQEAIALFRGAAVEYSAADDHLGICSCLTGLAEASALRRDVRRAAQLLGVIEATRERTATQGWLERSDYERVLKAVRAALDPDTLAAEWAVGRTQEPLAAIAAVPDEPQPETGSVSAPLAAAPALTHLRTLKAQWGGLTAREREVAVLVAQGRSNRQIAEDLVVSERTVEAHISNILSKLELTSRTQIATWAIGKGLAQARLN